MDTDESQENKRNGDYSPIRLGEDRSKSKNARNQSHQALHENCSGGTSPIQSKFSTRGAKNIGGILAQLEEIKAEHLGYIEAHEARLEKRLAEDKRIKAKATEKIDRLREEILDQLQIHPENIES